MYHRRVMRRKRRVQSRLSPFTKKAVDKEQSAKEELVKISKVVRSKFRELRNLEQTVQANAKPFVSPILESLKRSLPLPMLDVKTTIKPEPVETEYVKPTEKIQSVKNISTQTYQTNVNDTDLLNMYLSKLSNPANQHSMDTTYGVRLDGKGGTLIGDSTLTFDNGYASVQDKLFKISHGLLELLFMKLPDRQIINSDAVHAYKEILRLTNAHKQRYSAEKPINATKELKYSHVISQLFPSKKKILESAANSPSASGSGFGTVVRVNNNINSLVNRLRLLMLSKSAGHTAHEKEINRIILLLRRYKVIA